MKIQYEWELKSIKFKTGLQRKRMSTVIHLHLEANEFASFPNSSSLQTEDTNIDVVLLCSVSSLNKNTWRVKLNCCCIWVAWTS